MRPLKWLAAAPWSSLTGVAVSLDGGERCRRILRIEMPESASVEAPAGRQSLWFTRAMRLVRSRDV
jgi:hypothetical protein